MAAKRVLVTGAAGSPGVNFIDSLKDAPEAFDIVAVDCNRYHLQWVDVDHKFLVPECTHPDYLHVLNEIIDEYHIDVIHPQPDVEVKFLSENRDRINARTFLPSVKSVRILQDKQVTGLKWAAAGIRQNPTMPIERLDDIVNAAETLGLPFWMRATTGAGAKGSTLVENVETAWHWLQYWRCRGSNWTFIAEEFLPGKDYAWQSIWQDGELVTSQGRERLEYIYPHLAPSGRTGTPTVAMTVNNTAVNEIATRCVLAIDPKATGIFSVDLREDKNGNPVPTEINCGRFFTTSHFYSKAGVNMPYIYTKLALGEAIPAQQAYDPIEAGWYWIRHMDCPTVLVREEVLACEKPWKTSPLRIAA